jgi:hypothetical protein
VIPQTPPAAIGAPFSPTSSANGGWTSTAAADAAVDAGMEMTVAAACPAPEKLVEAEIPAEIPATPPDSREIQVARSSSMAN